MTMTNTSGSAPGATPVTKALWYVESHLGDDLSLDSVGSAAGVSRFHLSRAFSSAVGRSIMRYVRGRRLTEAARILAAGAPNILDVALGAGYASHEAFTRAFYEQFKLTPEALRERASLRGVDLIDPIRKDDSMTIELQRPRRSCGKRLLVAGLSERDCDRIAFTWQRFAPYLGNLPTQMGNVTYGVKANADDDGNFEYVAGVEVCAFEGLPAELTRIRIPEHDYAIFEHRGHVSTIRTTFQAIYDSWLAEAGLELADAPDFERFHPDTGEGVVEIWIPVRAATGS